jgi:hypothetical protein
VFTVGEGLRSVAGWAFEGAGAVGIWGLRGLLGRGMVVGRGICGGLEILGVGAAGGGLLEDVGGVKSVVGGFGAEGVGVVEVGTGVGCWGAVKDVGLAVKGSSVGFCVSWFLCAALAA